MLNTVPCTPSAVAVACDAIETCTRDTADDPVYAVVVVPPDVPSSGGPTHTGVFPARADPADGAAVSACLAGTETAALICAVPVCAAGHDTGGCRYGCIAGIGTFRPCTT
jgi:hypothetical protein